MKYNLTFGFLLSVAPLAYGYDADTVAVTNVTGSYRSEVAHLLRPLAPAAGPTDTKIRPFITDDARVVGGRLAQMESWVRFDRESGQHWTLFAYGATERLELTVGGVLGYERSEERDLSFSYALPLVQAKFLARPYGPGRGPGVGGVLGTFFPVGQGSFRPAGYGTFGFLTITQCFGQEEQVLIHANLGGNYLHVDGSGQFINTWGFGTQIKAYRGMHLVGELFSGDPYIPGTGTAYQLGYRYFFSDLVQIDMTIGNGIAGANPMPFWFSAGIRVVTERFRNRRAGKPGRPQPNSLRRPPVGGSRLMAYGL